jgi:superfamily I DNA and/or RNA helicase
MPGTGKTELIVKLIEKCHSLNKSVLITTFTNRSLDNILERTFNSGKIPIDKIIREGSRYSIDEKFEKLNSRSQKFTSIEEYQQYFQAKKLWFVTLASINIHHIPKMFDFVILDEASQSLEPVCI